MCCRLGLHPQIKYKLFVIICSQSPLILGRLSSQAYLSTLHLFDSKSVRNIIILIIFLIDLFLQVLTTQFVWSYFYAKSSDELALAPILLYGILVPEEALKWFGFHPHP
jgi:hypothetical protein